MLKCIKKVASGDKASQLLVLTLVVGVLPGVFLGADVQSPAIGLAFFILHLAICVVGFLTGRFRLFWTIWAITSVAALVLFGMTSPIGLLWALPFMFSY